MKKHEALYKFKRAMDRLNFPDKTQKSYPHCVGQFLDYCLRGKLTTTQEYVDNFVLTLKDWRTNRGGQRLKYSTINLYICAIKKYFKLVRNERIKAEDIRYLKEEHRLPKVMSKDEVRRLFEVTINLKHRLLLALAYGCGLRVSEAISIKISDLRLDRNIIIIFGKGRKERMVSIKNIPQGMFTPFLKNDRYLFEGQETGHLSARSAQKIFKYACYKAGIKRPLSFHSLRHSYGTHHLENGTDLREIQILMGHANIKTTCAYVQTADEGLMQIDSPIKDVIGI